MDTAENINVDSASSALAVPARPARRERGHKPQGGCCSEHRRLRDPRLYWRGKVIWCTVPDPEGTLTPTGKPALVRLTTSCRDEGAAVAKANEFEVRASNPLIRASLGYTLEECLNDYLANLATVESKANPGHRIKASTIDKIRSDKFGPIASYCDHLGYTVDTFPLAKVDSVFTTGYTKWRQGHAKTLTPGDTRTVCNYTIKRELGYLKSALKFAAFIGRFHASMERIFDPSFKGSARTVDRVPTPDQLKAILAGFSHLPERQAHIAFTAATGLRVAEVARIERRHVDMVNRTITVPGYADGTAKNAGSIGEIPITEVMLASGLLSFALARAPGGNVGPLFAPWVNPTLAMARVCKRSGLPKYSMHDLRRFFTHMHLDAGMSELGASKLLRQSKALLVSTIYGKTRQASKILARYGHEIRFLPAPMVAVETVQDLYGTADVNETNGAQLDEKTAEKAAIVEDQAPLNAAVHGGRAGDAHLGVTTQVAAADDTRLYVNLYEMPAGGHGPAGEALPSEPSRQVSGGEASSRVPALGGHGGAFDVGAAVEVVRQLFASHAASKAEREAVDQALAILARVPAE